VTFNNLDIYALSGDKKFTALTISFAVAVSDGVLNIGFSPTKDNAQICGIEIRANAN
jgi:hypothetical protein